MPNRIIKQSVCKSETIKQLTWFEEVFFYRLIVNCDDYGRADARVDALASDLFPIRRDITLKNIEAALNKLVTAGLVMVYEYDHQPYLQLLTWEKHQTIRNQKSKYPDPPDVEQLKAIESNCNQLKADVTVIQSNPNPNPNPNPKPKRAEAQGNIFEGRSFSESLKAAISDWLTYKKEKRQDYKETGLKNLLSQIENKCKKLSDAQIIYAISESMACNYQGIVWDKAKNNTHNDTQAEKRGTYI